MIDTNEIYETIGVGRGPVGLEPLFRALDEAMNANTFLDLPVGQQQEKVEIWERQIMDIGCTCSAYSTRGCCSCQGRWAAQEMLESLKALIGPRRR